MALVMFAALGGTASADVFDDNPAAVSLGPGNVQLFARGPDGRILHRTLNAGTWSNWAPVDGLDAGSGPAAVVFGDSVYLFARGATDGATYQNVLQNGAWSGWVSLGGGRHLQPRRRDAQGQRRDRPLPPRRGQRAVVADAHPRLGLGSLVAGGREPQLGAGGVRLLEPGLGGRRHAQRGRRRHADLLVQRRVAAPTNWRNKGGGITGAPAFASPATDILDLFMRSSANDGLYHHRHEVDPDGVWRLVDPTKLSSSPAGTSDENDHLFLFARIGENLPCAR